MMLEACNRTQHTEPDKEKDTQCIISQPERLHALGRSAARSSVS
jgi:hypothetical protein